MISALLLPLLIAAPADSAVAPPHDDPPIRLWINNDRRFLPGDRAKVQVRTSHDGYVIVLHVDPEGRLRVLFPLDPDRDNFVRGGKKYEIRGRGGRESFEVDNTTGKGTVYAAVSRDPFRFDGFVMGDHWDYKALAPSRLPDDPEPELNELVRRMAQGDFDYDLLTYYVSDRVAYASDYDYGYSRPAYYGSVYHDPWCYRFSCGRPFYRSSYGLSIGLFFGSPYRRYYHDPYFYDPFYGPFFHDPYYYAPIYQPYYGYPYPRYYGYDRYYYDRYRPYRQPYTPYRFRGADGIAVGFRDRRGPTRWVNTVYNPPISPVREAPTVTPVRRVRSSPLTDAPGAEPRRAADAQRVENDRPTEARRVGEQKRPNDAKPGRRVESTPKTELPRDVSPKRSVSGGEGRPAEARRSQEPDRKAGWPQDVSPRRSAADAQRVENRPIEARRAREIESPRAEPREMPRTEPVRTERREIERAAPEPRPARQIERPSAAPPQDRGGRRAEGESGGGGGGHSDGGARPSDGGGRRRR
jgi:hypothetical protein